MNNEWERVFKMEMPRAKKILIVYWERPSGEYKMTTGWFDRGYWWLSATEMLSSVNTCVILWAPIPAWPTNERLDHLLGEMLMSRDKRTE